jgi:molybdopterin molybdotransferase
MLSVSEAYDLILAQAVPMPAESVPLADATGRVLRETITTERDLPPFDRATMDGIALAYAAVAAGQRTFSLEGVQAAGQPARALQDAQAGCIEIMTGAVVPSGADTVIPYEEITKEHHLAVLGENLPVEPGQYIHRRGVDRRAGAVLLNPGCLLHAPQMAILASTGRTRVAVSARPRVAVVSVGDELVEPGQPIKDFQIRPSNAYGIRAALHSIGCPAVELVLMRDNPEHIKRTLADLLPRCDVLILSGGVSKGLFDFVPRALEQLGVRAIFHRVSQKPGMPMWFGTREDGRPVFALPGNPVSTLVCLHRLVRPGLLRALGAPLPSPAWARLGASFRLGRPLTHFLPARLDTLDAQLPTARLQTYHGSGDYAALGESDGFIELPPDQEHYDAGAVVRYHGWTS